MRINDLLFRIRTLLTLDAAERELKDEFAFHVAMERDKLIAQGMPEHQTDAEARRRFGGMTRESQRARDQWGIGVVRDLASDVRHAFRQFRRRPAFTIAGTLTLAIGIGATVSLFSVVRGTLLRPLPVANERDLHVFWQEYSWRGIELDFLKSRLTAFDGIAAFTTNGYTLGLGDETVAALASVVSAEIFDVLGVTPALGRTLATGDDRAGAEPRVVLSWKLWQRRFGGDSSIVGRRLTIDGAPVTVVGVMPRGFYFPTPEIEMWRPLDLNPATPTYANMGWLVLIGRAKNGATTADVNANIKSMAAALSAEYNYPQNADKTKDAHTTLLREYLQGNSKHALLLLLGAVVALLLMACANVAALVLSRTADRAPEMALRTALGANGGRLARQIIAESLALSVVAGAIGAALAASTFGILTRKLPLRDGLGTTLSVDWTIFATAICIAAVVSLFVAAAPVRSVLLGNLKGVGNERSAQGLRGHKRFHSTMVAAEMALGVTLTAGALLLVRSVSQLYSQETGFDPKGVITMDVVAPRDLDASARLQLLADVGARARAIPGVHLVGYVSRLPVRDGGGRNLIRSESRSDIALNALPSSFIRFVSPGYFTTMEIGIVRGRDFSDADRDGAEPVAIVSELFARQMWPGQDPIGQRIATGRTSLPWNTVIGVAEETRMWRMTGDNPIVAYFPTAQTGASGGSTLVAKTSGSQTATMAALREAVRGADKRAAVGRLIMMEDVVRISLADRLQLRFFLSLLAALALVLGAIGVYGVVSYAVSRRKAEFGVRMALGASSSRVMNEVAMGGLKPVMIGVAIGTASSLLLCRFVAQFLYGVSQRDVISIGGAAAALLLAGVFAVLIPGLRAGRTSPMEVLRSD
jgi:putative ABC transport system permease protein